MRYSPEHKARTRERILREAGRLFRRHGYRGVGIDQIMAKARLTRGGFYAHFASKAALFAAVVDQESDFVRRLRAARDAATPQGVDGACAVVSAYLDPRNREKVARGCTMATLTQDVPRTGPTAKAAYARRFLELATEFERHLPAELPARIRRERAFAAVTLCVGGLDGRPECRRRGACSRRAAHGARSRLRGVARRRYELKSDRAGATGRGAAFAATVVASACVGFVPPVLGGDKFQSTLTNPVVATGVGVPPLVPPIGAAPARSS